MVALRCREGLLGEVSAVDDEFGACHEARLVRGKEETAVRNFKRGACVAISRKVEHPSGHDCAAFQPV